jgi:hypothetical protein
MQEQSRILARRLLDSICEPKARVSEATMLVWSRAPSEEESSKALAYVENCKHALAGSAQPSENIEVEAWASYARVLLASNQFFYVD